MERLDTAVLVRMSTTLKVALDAAAASDDVPVSDLIRSLIRADLRRRRRRAE
jgi:hypothetical protein